MIDYLASFLNTNLAAFPGTEAVNVTAPGAGDGTEFVELMVNDIWGRAQAIMNYAGLTPDGVTEADGTAQILSALSKGWGIGPGMGVIYWPSGAPAANGDRVLLLQGQVILIASYPLLAARVYCGDPSNPTAPAFYKTSDAGGVTRDTAGGYLVLPDARGLSLKNIGDATVNGRVKTGPVSIGEKQEDMHQKITGGWANPSYSVSWSPVQMVPSGAFSNHATTAQHSNALATGANITIGFTFDSANSPDARVSATTAGATRDSVLGTNYGITY